MRKLPFLFAFLFLASVIPAQIGISAPTGEWAEGDVHDIKVSGGTFGDTVTIKVVFERYLLPDLVEEYEVDIDEHGNGKQEITVPEDTHRVEISSPLVEDTIVRFTW